MKILNSIISALTVGTAIATKGVDFSTPLSLSTFKCFKENGMSFAIPRAYRSYGSFDTNAIENIKNARAAGIPYVDVYAFPCRSKSAKSQIDDLIQKLGSKHFLKFVGDRDTNPIKTLPKAWLEKYTQLQTSFALSQMSQVANKDKQRIAVYNHISSHVPNSVKMLSVEGSKPNHWQHVIYMEKVSEFRSFFQRNPNL
jgi:hypothetical protein